MEDKVNCTHQNKINKMEKLTVEEVNKIDVPSILNEIMELKKGEGLKMLMSEHHQKTPPTTFFNQGKYKGLVRVVKKEDWFLLIKK